MTDLEGKVAFVTGAARGQGRAHALTLAKHGADIIALDIAEQIDSVFYPMSTADDLAETARGVEALGRRVIAMKGDTRSQSDLDAAVQAGLDSFGSIDILIANAAVNSLGSFWELTEQAWSDVVDTNLSGVWRSAKAVAPHMIERESGSIVMVGSVNSLESGARFSHYISAKHGLIGLMKAVALELAPYRIRCNAICPGAIDTGMMDNQKMYDMFAGHEGGTREDMLGAGTNYHAIRGAGVLSPQRVADAALWLVSDGSEMVTGATVPVDAGHGLLPRHNPGALA